MNLAVVGLLGVALSGCGRSGFGLLATDAALNSDSSLVPDAALPSVDAAVDAFAFTGIDPSFGSSGRVVLGDASENNAVFSVHGIAVQPDGRIVLAGKSGAAGDTNALVVRLLDDGTLDPSFGVAGLAEVDYGLNDSGHGLALQPDGKILVGINGGSDGDPGSVVARLQPDGSLDPSFGSAGLSLVDFPFSFDVSNGVLLTTDGKIVFGGQHCCAATGFDMATSRLLANGSLDPSFGINGLVTTDVVGSDEFGSPVAVQPDGSIYSFASGWNGATNFDMVLVRHLANGDLDASFGTGGAIVADIGGTRDGAADLAVYEDGRVILVGTARTGAESDFALLQFDSAGVPDASFGVDGVLTIDMGAQEQLHAVRILPDGRIAVVGSSDHAGDANIVVFALSPDGDIDTSIGLNGFIEVDVVPGQEDRAWGMAVDANAMVVVFGETHDGTQDDLVVLRIAL